MVDCQVRPSDVTKYPIIAALLDVPREAFVPADKRDVAYAGEHIMLENGRVVMDPRVLSKMLDFLDISPDELVLDLGAGLGYSTAVIAKMAEAVVAVEEDADMAAEAEASFADHSVDNAAMVTGPIAEGAPKHGPYDVISVNGAIEEMPAAILDQLKLGGRICAIFMDGPAGRCCLGVKTDSGVSWRRAFDATAPVLPGFEKQSEFVF